MNQGERKMFVLAMKNSNLFVRKAGENEIELCSEDKATVWNTVEEFEKDMKNFLSHISEAELQEIYHETLE